MSTSEFTQNSIEQASGKDAGYENFPVGSWLLPARLRPHIMVYYEFARAIDDIADSALLNSNEKIERLDGYARHLNDEANEAGYDKAVAMRESLRVTGITQTHCLELITAFKQDAVQQRYDSWNDLLAYCRLSAVPVGRYLIDLHGGCSDQYNSSDALCSALQIINHLQDLGDDFQQLDRVYLPVEWLNDAGTSDNDLALSACTAGVREVVNRMLDGVSILIDKAYPISKKLNSRRLALEASVILMIARALRNKLAHHDPLTSRVELRKPELALCSVRGILSGII